MSNETTNPWCYPVRSRDPGVWGDYCFPRMSAILQVVLLMATVGVCGCGYVSRGASVLVGSNENDGIRNATVYYSDAHDAFIMLQRNHDDSEKASLFFPRPNSEDDTADVAMASTGEDGRCSLPWRGRPIAILVTHKLGYAVGNVVSPDTTKLKIERWASATVRVPEENGTKFNDRHFSIKEFLTCKPEGPYVILRESLTGTSNESLQIGRLVTGRVRIAEQLWPPFPSIASRIELYRWTDWIDLTSGQRDEVELPMPGCRVFGTLPAGNDEVVRLDDASPLPADENVGDTSSLHIQSTYRQRNELLRHYCVRPQANGMWEFPRVAPGTYRISVLRHVGDRIETAYRSLDVPLGEHAINLNMLVFKSWSTIMGH